MHKISFSIMYYSDTIQTPESQRKSSYSFQSIKLVPEILKFGRDWNTSFGYKSYGDTK